MAGGGTVREEPQALPRTGTSLRVLTCLFPPQHLSPWLESRLPQERARALGSTTALLGVATTLPGFDVSDLGAGGSGAAGRGAGSVPGRQSWEWAGNGPRSPFPGEGRPWALQGGS